MAGELDVIVVGGGPAGENVAARCAAGGLAVALVERELLGGECSYWACIPSKALLRPGEALAQARRVPGAAERTQARPDAAAALAWRDELVHGWDDGGQADWVEGAGVRLVRGHGRLAGEREVEVDGERLRARRAVVVATGSVPRVPPVAGLEDVPYWTNRGAAEAREAPASLLVLGGGPVGCELGQAFHRLGSEVAIVEAAPHLLAREEPFAGEELAAALRAEGVEVATDAQVDAVREHGCGVAATVAGGRVLEAERLLVASGRAPATRDLGLETVGLQPGEPLRVDDALRATGVAGGWLYAVGDANGRVLLTHMGKYQARLAADAILGREVEAFADHRAVPRVVFTDPQVTAVGLTERQAREAGLAVRVVDHGTGEVAGSSVLGEGLGGRSRLVVDEERRVVVGATFTGQNVQELLHSATVAIVGEVPLERLWHAVPSFPTVSEVWLRLLESYGL